MTDRPSGVPEATAGAVDLLINREHALERERELEAEIERWRAKWAEADKQYWRLLDGEWRATLCEIASLRGQNATLRAEVERLTNGGAE